MSFVMKVRTQKSFAPWAVTAVLVLLVAAVTAGAASEVSISVIVPDVQDPGRAYYTDVLVPAFERETGIKVDLHLREWGGYLDYLLTLFAAGEAPDVVQIGGEALGTFVRSGLVQPLDTWADRWGELDDFAGAAILDGTVEGRLYTIPYRLDQRPLLYRIDYFEESGLDGNSPPTTWEELRDAALKLVRTDADGSIQRAGLNTGPAGDLVAIFIYQNGGRLVAEDGRRAAFDSREAIDAVQFLVDLVNVYRVGLPTGSPWEGADPIVTGRAAMEYHGDWALGQMERAHPENAGALGVAIPPGQVNRSGFLYVNKWAITSASKNPDAAWKWIEYVSRPEVMYELSRVNSFLPPRRGALLGPPFTDDPRWLVFLQAAEETVPLPGNTYNLGALLSQLSQGADRALKQEESVEAALRAAAQQATVEITRE